MKIVEHPENDMDSYPYRNQGRTTRQENDSVLFTVIAIVGMALIIAILIITN